MLLVRPDVRQHLLGTPRKYLMHVEEHFFRVDGLHLKPWKAAIAQLQISLVSWFAISESWPYFCPFIVKARMTPKVLPLLHIVMADLRRRTEHIGLSYDSLYKAVMTFTFVRTSQSYVTRDGHLPPLFHRLAVAGDLDTSLANHHLNHHV